jgi:hypothetical protein
MSSPTGHRFAAAALVVVACVIVGAVILGATLWVDSLRERPVSIYPPPQPCSTHCQHEES